MTPTPCTRLPQHALRLDVPLSRNARASPARPRQFEAGLSAECTAQEVGDRRELLMVHTSMAGELIKLLPNEQQSMS